MFHVLLSGLNFSLDGNMFLPLLRAFKYVVFGAGAFCLGVIILLMLIGVVVRIINHFKKKV